MRIAYLVLAHHQPAHLARLVRALDTADSRFFVHVDRRTDLQPFAAALGEAPRVQWLVDRVPVRWGGFSVVDASLRLLSTAVRADPALARFCLLSGSDYPLKSAADIQGLLAGAADHEFMRVDRRVADGDHHWHTRYLRRWWFLDAPSPLGRLSSGRLVRRRRCPIVTPYHGSQWWALTRACATHVLEVAERHPELADYFRHAGCADEFFFHSIVKHSPFTDRITEDFERNGGAAARLRPNQHGAHYIDWQARGVPLPKVLDMDDLPALLDSPALFARKFHPVVSASLLDALDQARSGPARPSANGRGIPQRLGA